MIPHYTYIDDLKFGCFLRRTFVCPMSETNTDICLTQVQSFYTFIRDRHLSDTEANST